MQWIRRTTIIIREKPNDGTANNEVNKKVSDDQQKSGMGFVSWLILIYLILGMCTSMR